MSELKNLHKTLRENYVTIRDLKARVDRLLELLREILDEVFPDDEYWPELFSRELIDRLAKELRDANS